MEAHQYEVWDNVDNPIRYTIIRNDGVAWILEESDTQGISTPSFIGPLGKRENSLGEKLIDSKWPLSIVTWLDERSLLE